MTWLAICRDGPQGKPLRERHLGAHLAHVETAMDRYYVAGPLKDSNGATVGSLLIVEAEDERQARAFVESDPYHAAGVWQDVEVVRFLPVAGRWVGGAAWKR